MRKLLVAFALVPALSHAALLIDKGDMHKGGAPTAPAPVAASSAVPAQSAPVIRVAPVEPVWTVTPADGNLRQLLKGWAKRAGWDFPDEAWAVDKDVPIQAQDRFTGDFKSAVRRTLSATEMTSYQLKPCFYSNNTLRVVKITTKCDPSK